jgi:diguanylate cyclase (GGDEF)-like protein
VDLWSKGTLKSLVMPGGILLLAAAVLLQGGFLTISAAAVSFYYYAVFLAGILLAWRFHSSRVLFALVSLFLAHRAMDFFSAGRVASAGPGRIALEAVAILLPLNFIAFSLIRERGFALPAIASRLMLLFLESVFVAVLCRPGATSGAGLVNPSFFGKYLSHLTLIPPMALLAFLVAAGVLLSRFFLYRKPVESGLLWSLAATFVALEAGGVGRIATAYLGTAGLVLVSSIIENSYLLAYHDELTSLPARRAFNDALFRLQTPFSVAMVDIDHFKQFNDTYGHETGDEVLRLVASRLARVSGGGQAYRCGGEEFAILFPGKTTREVVDHLELLRATIETSSFRHRGTERRQMPRGSDRRNQSTRGSARGRLRTGRAIRQLAHSNSLEALSVTVSIGVASSTGERPDPGQVIDAADRALYRAKATGRNRLETASPPRRRGRAKTAEIA